MLSATVRVPLSYFPIAYKRLHPSAATLDEATLAAATKAELIRIRDGVKNIVGLKADSDLSVDYYADAPVDLTAMASGPSTPVASLSTVMGHPKEIGIAVLAIVSLLMMATLVRKSSPPPLAIGAGAGTGAGGSPPASRKVVPHLGHLTMLPPADAGSSRTVGHFGQRQRSGATAGARDVSC